MNKSLFDSEESLDSFGEVSKRYPDSINGFAIDDLVWEHFTLSDGQLEANKTSDKMIPTINELSGGINGMSVLELGPYEGYYSIALEAAGIKQNVSIEANPANYLKCLVVKNHYNLKNTHYMLGDLSCFLEKSTKKYDLVLASGILYHLFDPYVALEHINTKTDRIGICTTYFHPEIQNFKFTGDVREVNFPGLVPLHLHERINPRVIPGKKHGVESVAWMFEPDELLRYLEYRGFESTVFYQVENPKTKQLRIRIYAERKNRL
jgi:hypothetical protein